MIVGILSMQRINNYGSFLQALSLKIQFEERGHDVYFVDIENGIQLVTRPIAKNNILSKFDRYFIKRIQNFLMSKKMDSIHQESQMKYLQLDKTLAKDKIFDLVVIGSDEVFNVAAPSSWGFSKQLFGDVKNSKKIVTYAASCGSTDYHAIEHLGIVEQISSSLSKLECLSVRDENTYNFVKAFVGCSKRVSINIDPVFLSCYDKYIPPINIKKSYLLVYAYPNRIYDEEEIKVIKEYAYQHNLQIICVGMQQRWCSKNICANAFELLGYVKNAYCVVTDTFHGTVFSIKYNKQFVALIRESNKNKLGFLLKQFNLLERCVEHLEEFSAILDTPIDYSKINDVISVEQRKSKEYLDYICNME